MLELADVTKSFGARRVLDGLTFTVRSGEVFGLLGPNGAGKSTAFNIICNLLLPDSGSVRVLGRASAEVPRAALGVVGQSIAIYKNLTCAENLAFFGALYGLRGEVLKARVAHCLAEVRLQDRQRSLARDLSGGMQRRLHVAIALLHDPSLVILDEPSAGLDVEARREQWAVVRRLQVAGKAVLLTTHLLEEAEELCSRVAVLRAGRIIAQGTPDELRARVGAAELAQVQSPEPDRVVEAAVRAGLTVRRTEHALVILVAAGDESARGSGYLRRPAGHRGVTAAGHPRGRLRGSPARGRAQGLALKPAPRCAHRAPSSCDHLEPRSLLREAEGGANTSLQDCVGLGAVGGRARELQRADEEPQEGGRFRAVHLLASP